MYRSLIEAEKIIRATEIFAPSIIGVDFDADNVIEYLYQGSELNAYLHTRGGALFELDFLPASCNYLDTLAQRDGGRSERASAPHAFIDHFLRRGVRWRSSRESGSPSRPTSCAGAGRWRS